MLAEALKPTDEARARRPPAPPVRPEPWSRASDRVGERPAPPVGRRGPAPRRAGGPSKSVTADDRKRGQLRDLNNLALFAAVVRCGGFSAASRAIGAPKSRISRHVSALEDQLGVRLLERSTRNLKVTAVGKEVYQHAQAALAEAEAIADAVSRVKAEPQGLVRVTAPPAISHLLDATIPSFLRRNPKLRLQMMVTNRRVDLIEEGIDIAIQIRDRLDSDADMQVRVLHQTGALLVASPNFIAEHGAPEAPADLLRFPTISLDEQPGAERWNFVHESGITVEVAHEPRISAGMLSIVRQAVLEGAGIAMLPDHICRGLIESGDLVRVLPAWSIPQGVLHLVFTSRRGLLLGIRTVIDFLVQNLSSRSPVWQAASGT